MGRRSSGIRRRFPRGIHTTHSHSRSNCHARCMFLATLPLAVQRRRILSARSLLSKGLVLGLGASSFDSIDLSFMRNWLNVIDLPWVGDSSISTAYFVPREDIHPSWFSTRAGGPTYRLFPSFTQSTIQSPMRMLRKNFRFPG